MIDRLPKFISEKAKILEQAGIESAEVEVEWILCHLRNVDRLQLYLDGAAAIDDAALARFDEIMQKRLTRYPLQYILEESWFYGRRFFVSPAVMVPTPETEVLCEHAIGFSNYRHLDRPRILDVGVGSGVISVTIANELPESSILALDVSPEAIKVAKRNAETLGGADRIEFRQSDMFSSVREDEKFDVILSNPPYITETDYRTLQPEVLADPRLALVSGEDGLNAIRAILDEAPNHLAGGGRIMFEIGYDQSDKIARLTESDRRFTSLNIIKDLNDIDRVVILGCGD